MEREKRVDHNRLKKEFLIISKLINDELDVEPIMFGKFGLQEQLNMYLDADVLDILIPEEYISGLKKQDWLLFLTKHGYKANESNSFTKNNTKFTYDSFERYQKLGNINLFESPGFYDVPEDLSENWEESFEYIKNHKGYYIFTIRQYLEIYKELNDLEKIKYIESIKKMSDDKIRSFDK